MTSKREYQRMEKRLRKSLLEKHKKFERSKSYWKKIFDKAYPPKTGHEPGWLWRQTELASVDYEILPQWKKDILRSG